MDNRLISQEVAAILKAYLFMLTSRHSGSTGEFLEMCGSWQDERDTDEIIGEIRGGRRWVPDFPRTFFNVPA